jgi:hypothetical protein
MTKDDAQRRRWPFYEAAKVKKEIKTIKIDVGECNRLRIHVEEQPHEVRRDRV